MTNKQRELKKILTPLILDQADCVLIIDDEGKIVFTNESIEHLFGYTEEELLGQQMEILVPDQYVSRHKKHREEYNNKPRKRGFKHKKEFVAKHKLGDIFPVEISLCPLNISQGNFYTAQIIDITDQKKLLEKLREGQKKLANIIETAIDGIITINTHGIIESANPAAQRLFGYTEEELKGQNVNTLMANPYHEQHDNYINSYLKTRHAKIIGIGREVEGLRKDGTIFPFWLSVSEIKTENRTIFTGLVHDLTEQKRAERALQASADNLAKRVESRTAALADAIKTLENEIREKELIQRELEDKQRQIEAALEKEKELNELKSRFISTASHEFRTPLATILSSTNLIDKYHDPDKKERRIKHINRIKSNVKNLTNILDDFMSLSKLEEGIIEVKPTHFDLNEFMQELIEEFQLQAKTGQQITYLHEGESTNIYLDDYLLKNILSNLLSNALKYSPENSTISIYSKIEKTNLELKVIDKGIGIPIDEQKRLFERFFRAKNAINIQGTGLGLSIVKKYVELMGGTIGFESIPYEGTTFALRFQNSNHE